MSLQAPDWPEVELEMANCGHTIDDEMATTLRCRQVLGTHAGLNFCGVVWFKDGRFHEQVAVHHRDVAVHSADTLEELMRSVNDEFGWD